MKVEINAMNSQELSFKKITETACLSGWEFEANNHPYDFLNIICNLSLKLNEWLLNILNRPCL